MSLVKSSPRARIGAGAIAFAVQVAIGYALLTGLSVHIPALAADPLKLFQIAPSPPPPRPERLMPKPVQSAHRAGAAAPPNLKSKATEVVAPPPIVVTTVPPPVIVTRIADGGARATSGAARIAGPGTGAGGVGNGTGSGGAGDGDGNGGTEMPPRRIGGRINARDLLRNARGLERQTAEYTASMRYTVQANGRVADCQITHSSGNASLDATFCELITDRFRYDPARTATGRPVSSTVVTDQTLDMEDATRQPNPDR